jgi:hypothetical protein
MAAVEMIASRTSGGVQGSLKRPASGIDVEMLKDTLDPPLSVFPELKDPD